MNHDFIRDPVEDDAFFDELAATIDLVDDMTRERLAGGELDRRREQIMGRSHVRRGTGRQYALAAAVVLFAVLAVGALFTYGHRSSTSTGDQSSSSRQIDPLPRNDNGPGLGGPELTGQRYGGTDPRTSVRLDVAMEKKVWGTQVSFAVSSLHGPMTCRLIAVHTDGTNEPLVSWKVGADGWGTAANPEPLLLQAITATPREEISYLQVQEVDENGAGATLVRVP